MTSKLNYYDVLGVLLPGVLILGVLIWVLPINPEDTLDGVPGSFLTLILTGFALVIGQVVQGVGSLIEPLLFLSWGGTPSDQLLSESRFGKHFLPAASSKRIRDKLKNKILKGENHDFFLYALTLAGGEKGRVGVFNGLYAHHRGLLVGSLLTIVIVLCRWSSEQIASFRCELLLLAVLMTLIFWWRTRARAYYFAREVLLAAEQALDE